MNAVLGPELASGAGDAIVVEGADDVQHPGARLCHVEDALDDRGTCSRRFQSGALLGPVLDVDLALPRTQAA